MVPAQPFPCGEWLQVLRRIFGFDSFRPHQEDIVRAVHGARDVFAVMPTGGGKSLCYQLPSRMLPGTTLVISPLIALMKDQVDGACKLGLRAAFLNSSQSEGERAEVTRRLQGGDLDLLYVAPERLAQEAFLQRIRGVPLNLTAIDEAHCISEWGHDFRPDYLPSAQLSRNLRHVPMAAFTATATCGCRPKSSSGLRLREPLLVRGLFDRPNLFFEVQPRRTWKARSWTSAAPTAGSGHRLPHHPGKRGANRQTPDRPGLKALPYHAGMDGCPEEGHQEEPSTARRSR